MLRGERIVCLSSLLWGGRPSAMSQLAGVLAAENEVLFVDPPRNLARDLVGQRRRPHRGRLHREQTLLRFEPPPHLPIDVPLRDRLFIPLDQWRYQGAVARVLRRLGWDRPIVWNVAPLYFSAGIAARLRPKLHFLHMTDLYWDVAGWEDTRQRENVERELRLADFAVGSSPAMAESLAERGFVAHHVGHGVDVARFEPVARGEIEPAAGIRDLPRPRVGFVGQIDKRLDVDTVRALAGSAGSMVLVGPSNLPASAMAEMAGAGCHLIGEVSYDEVPRWMAGFDVAVLPYRPIPWVIPSRPLKLLEYMAAGLPCVALDIPTARELAPHVITAATGADFVREVTAVWAARDRQIDDATVRQARVDAARPHSWHQRGEELSQLIEAALASAGSGDRPRR